MASVRLGDLEDLFSNGREFRSLDADDTIKEIVSHHHHNGVVLQGLQHLCQLSESGALKFLILNHEKGILCVLQAMQSFHLDPSLLAYCNTILGNVARQISDEERRRFPLLRQFLGTCISILSHNQADQGVQATGMYALAGASFRNDNAATMLFKIGGRERIESAIELFSTDSFLLLNATLAFKYALDAKGEACSLLVSTPETIKTVARIEELARRSNNSEVSLAVKEVIFYLPQDDNTASQS